MTYNQLQLADLLQINRVYAARLIREQKLPAVKVGRAYKIRQNDIESFLKTTIKQHFFKISDICRLFKLHRAFVAKLICENKIKAVRIGRFYRVPEKEITKYINSNIPDKVYTIPELAGIFHTARTNLVRSIRQNKLKAIKIDGEYRIAKIDAEEYFHVPLY